MSVTESQKKATAKYIKNNYHRVMVNLKLDEDIEIQKIAKENNMTQAAFIRYCINKELSSRKGTIEPNISEFAGNTDFSPRKNKVKETDDSDIDNEIIEECSNNMNVLNDDNASKEDKVKAMNDIIEAKRNERINFVEKLKEFKSEETKKAIAEGQIEKEKIRNEREEKYVDTWLPHFDE